MPKTTSESRFARYKFYYLGAIYHIYNRGNGKESIFINETDYFFYLKRLKENLIKHQVSLFAYCLMPNHIHLLVKQLDNEPIHKFISSLHTSYAKVFNKKYDKVGHMFQDRFKQVIVESEEQLLHLTRYIHINPYIGGLVLKPEDFKWSSYREYLGIGSNSFCKIEEIQGLLGVDNFEKKYRDFTESMINEEEINLIKDAVIEAF